MPIFKRSASVSIDYNFWRVGDDNQACLVLINGHTRPWTDFRNLARKLNASHPEFDILSLDNRGSGNTHYSGPFSMQDMAEDVLELMQYYNEEQRHPGCPITSWVVCGFSMGGLIAQQLLQTVMSEKAYRTIDVDNIILCSSSDRSAAVTAGPEWGDSLEKITAKLETYFSASYVSKNTKIVQAMAKQILKSIDEGVFEQRASHQRAAMQDLDFSEILSATDVPVKLIHGELDAVISACESQRIKSYLQERCSLALLPGHGHLLLAEALPDLVDNIGGVLQS